MTDFGDPLDTSAGIPYDVFARLRAEAPVWRTASGVLFFSQFDDVLAATKDIESSKSSFRDPGVVVPEEEQLISEIEEPRHGKIRRIVNSAIAAHRLGRVEDFARETSQSLLERVLEKGGGRWRVVVAPNFYQVTQIGGAGAVACGVKYPRRGGLGVEVCPPLYKRLSQGIGFFELWSTLGQPLLRILDWQPSKRFPHRYRAAFLIRHGLESREKRLPAPCYPQVFSDPL